MKPPVCHVSSCRTCSKAIENLGDMSELGSTRKTEPKHIKGVASQHGRCGEICEADRVGATTRKRLEVGSRLAAH